ncbi:lactate utilization protein [Dethiosulfatarculus sandiegensis]|uniref:LUD domain-containing protein n=1 Tax=Dethiosulfatarculus sandiegensis TaxID=1429043 RepID=A0A0D2K0Q2_9BACT|nr:lactate utilization protein [Dethiosulfatarculus sandiegensis]KIX15310.1 hypothetical protein X474_03985 [Dethiosulfatarculus sandiegensis]
MSDPIANFWKIRLHDTKEALLENNFEVYIAEDLAQAKAVIKDEILPGLEFKSVGRGGSLTVDALGFDSLLDQVEVTKYDPFDKDHSDEKKFEMRRQGLLSDLFFTGTNALTADGRLVNLDAFGNRVAAMMFGPKHVIIPVGRNKIVPDLEAAEQRIKDYTAPTNAMRLARKTPCVKTGRCMDCSSPDRICSAWTIIEKCLPKGRIKVVLINQDLGF